MMAVIVVVVVVVVVGGGGGGGGGERLLYMGFPKVLTLNKNRLCSKTCGIDNIEKNV